MAILHRFYCILRQESKPLQQLWVFYDKLRYNITLVQGVIFNKNVCKCQYMLCFNGLYLKIAEIIKYETKLVSVSFDVQYT